MALCDAGTSMNRSMQTQWSLRADSLGDKNTSAVDVAMEFVPSMVHNNNNNNMHYIGIITSLVKAHEMPDMPVQCLPQRLLLMALFSFSTARIIYGTTLVYGTLVISCTLKLSTLDTFTVPIFFSIALSAIASQ